VESHRFWQELGAEHAGDLARYGPELVKRRQALRYFTWAWTWSSLWWHPQPRFLMRHTRPSIWHAAATQSADLSDAAWKGSVLARRDRWLYVFLVRLLWEYARQHDELGVLRLSEPPLGSPFPVRWKGRLISQDLANGSLESTAMARALGTRIPSSILEIGAGYGRTAYVLLNLYPEATYTIVDVEPSLGISRWYLSQLFPRERIRWLQADEAGSVIGSRFDLALSISSMQEMSRARVRAYLELLDDVAAGGFIYLKQWRDWHNPVDGGRIRFTSDYPIPARWQLLFNETAPVQTNFNQAAWRIPGA
jgi:putative sugar O-methyltransferase